MEIAQIVSTAKEKIGSNSLSDRTITDYFTAVNPQNEPDDAFWNTHLAILKSINGNFSHDVSVWKKEFEEAHPATPPTPPAPKTEGIAPEVQAILDGYKTQIEEMKGLIKTQQSQHSAEALRQGAQSKADELKVSNRNVWNDAVSRVTIKEGMTAEQFNAEVKNIYEQNVKLFVGDGVQPYGAAGSGDPSARTKAMLDDFFASKGFGKK